MSTRRIGRRNLLKTGALISIGGAVCAGAYFMRLEKQTSALSAASSSSGRHFGVKLDHFGQPIKFLDVPKRSHASVLNSRTGEVLFFARRPGNEIFVFSNSDKQSQLVTAAAGRHFYGHGVLDPEHRYLLTTENNYSDGTGRIVIRDVLAGYKVAHEYSSSGVGPHELVFLNADVIAVANGGIRSHPSAPREDMNVDSMAPNVTFFQWRTGRRMASFAPSNAKLSLRHLARLSDQAVVVAAQSHDWLTPQQSLVYKVDASGEGTAYVSDTLFAANRRHYIASVCTVGERIAVTTSPKSGHLDFWIDNKWSHSLTSFDVAGVCSLPGSRDLLFSNGRGDMVRAASSSSAELDPTVLSFKGIHWDNHLIAV